MSNVLSRWWSRHMPARPGKRFLVRDLLRRKRDINQDQIRSLCTTVVIHGRMALTRVLGRYKLYVDPADYSISVHLMLEGYWEMWLTEELARQVRPGMTVADIGANLGYFTLLMADLVGPQGRVLAFEPNLQVADLMRRSVHANGFDAIVTISPDPLGAVSGEPVNLYFNPEQAGGAFVTTEARDDFRVGLPLVTRRFDDHPDALRVAVAKMDAEGSEERIWAGMVAALAGDALKTVVMEWCGCRYADPGAFLDAMSAPGFSLAWLDPARGVVPISADAILAEPPSREWLLVLRR